VTGRPTTECLSFAMLLLVISAALSCGPIDEHQPPAQSTGIELTPVVVPGLDTLGPEKPSAYYAMSASGRIAFTNAFTTTSYVITVIDTNGRLLHRIAPRGGGPGELESDQYVFMRYVGDTLVVYNVNKQSVITFGPDGNMLRATESFAGGIPTRLSIDSSDFQVMSTENLGRVENVYRYSSATGAGRPMIVAGDAMYDSLRTAEPWALTLSGLVISSQSEIVVADHRLYRFQVYDSEGRPQYRWQHAVEPRYNSDAMIDSTMKLNIARGTFNPVTMTRRPHTPGELADLEKFLRAPLPQFNAMVFDESGRLWVFGTDDKNEPVADVFARKVHVGRIRLPCRSGGGMAAPSFQGSYVLILCENKSLDAGVELRLYRTTNE
jgi:hypothetical protein